MGFMNSLSEKQENNKYEYKNLKDNYQEDVYKDEEIEKNQKVMESDDFDSNLKYYLMCFLNNIFMVISVIKKEINIKNKSKKKFEDGIILSNLNTFNHKKRIIIIFIWLIWITNVAIFTNKDLVDLFFPDMTSIKYMLLFCSLFILLETLNIVNGGYYNFHNIIFYIYFAILLMISFKSLLYNKGQAWQFYLIIIIINLNSKFLNIKY